MMMTKFYLDTEYTNGNFYIGDIFEIALIAEESRNVFHTLIKIPSKVSNYIEFFCGIKNNILQSCGLTFQKCFTDMTDFINKEAQSDDDDDDDIVIIAHGGFLSDFPLLLINCLKNECDTDVMRNYKFIDSLKILQNEQNNEINNHLSLEKLAKLVLDKTPEEFHAAFYDAETLLLIFQENPYKTILNQNINITSFSLTSIHDYVHSKMPLSIELIYTACSDTQTVESLIKVLSMYLRENTALKKSTVKRISDYYFTLNKKK